MLMRLLRWSFDGRRVVRTVARDGDQSNCNNVAGSRCDALVRPTHGTKQKRAREGEVKSRVSCSAPLTATEAQARLQLRPADKTQRLWGLSGPHLLDVSLQIGWTVCIRSAQPL